MLLGEGAGKENVSLGYCFWQQCITNSLTSQPMIYYRKGAWPACLAGLGPTVELASMS